ncbi:MAG: CRISPR-associated protein Cas5 [Nanopusillaceae archaeon]
MKALVFKFSFFEALFKVHYTKAFKLSYPAPLPTTILGMIGNICGYDRRDTFENLKDFYYGSAMIKGNILEENATYIQIGKNIKGVTKYQLYNDVEHLIIVAGNEKMLEEKILSKIKILDIYEEDNYGKWYNINLTRYLYGGQNDYFAKDFKILKDLINVEEKKIIKGGYILVEEINKIDKSVEMQILPVKYNNALKYFAFIKYIKEDKNEQKNKEIKVELKNSVKTVFDIPIYSINGFNYL